MTEPEEGQTQEEAGFALPDEWRSLDLIFDQVEKQLDIQWQLWESVDGRLRLLLGFIGVIFAVALGFTAGDAQLGSDAKLLALAGVFLFLVSTILTGVGYFPHPFDRPPRPDYLRLHYLATEPEQTKLDLVDTMMQAYNENEGVIAQKLLLFKVAFVLMGIGVLLVGLAVASQLARA